MVTDATQMPRRGKRFQPHMQRSEMWGYKDARICIAL
ncbi:hypothetical protein Barb4_01539 [Bacteroidales bacterium Barb4]|nr:hypothetical protein Barb4_01539 [Bacteroidales bacterium Barb4]